MELSNKTKRRTATCVATLTAAGLSFGVVSFTGGSPATAASGTTGTTGDTAARTANGPGHGPGGGPLGQLTDDQVQCLKDEGVNVPDKPKTGERPQRPDSSDRPDPDEMKAAAEACGIDLPEPPSGGEMRAGPPPQGDGKPCAHPHKGDKSDKKSDTQKDSGSKKKN